MTLFVAVILGIVQGLGEFLPISSSAHLVLTPWVFNWKDPGLSFDVALHLGTLVAVLAFFWKDWLQLTVEGLTGKRSREGRMFWYLVAATIPGAAFGFLLEDYIATIFRNPLLIGILLIIMGIILYLADRLSPAWKGLYQMRLKDSLIIGLSQAFALIPGVSRSGITMTAGRMLGLDRETSARFSFLLSTPIIMGAGILNLRNITPADLTLPFITGVLVSAVIGFVAIKFLLKFLVNNNFTVFVIYRFVLGTAIIMLALSRG
ncbi:MAG: UDP-diphosphatase [Peptococcaceae bacterium BICA1-7]|nr:MAG: UDP-diphosphatase [Peptococcaceae bacterium BICA1-7]HBV97321.1 undecaprenyl-diphosphatase UppP [Desulfotomaculum sp.]